MSHYDGVPAVDCIIASSYYTTLAGNYHRRSPSCPGTRANGSYMTLQTHSVRSIAALETCRLTTVISRVDIAQGSGCLPGKTLTGGGGLEVKSSNRLTK